VIIPLLQAYAVNHYQLKEAIDWASRPWGTNSFARKPSAAIGASPGKIGTAVSQQSLRSVLSFCNSPQTSAPEAYIQYQPDMFTSDGEVTDDTTAGFLRDFMEESVHRQSAHSATPAELSARSD
jgi:chromate reductase